MNIKKRALNFSKAFTLVEMITVSLILGFILTIIISIYFKMIEIKTDVLIQNEMSLNTKNIIERINIDLKNYTIDYEEYFNRKNTGCNGNVLNGENFERNIGENGNCENFTTYGNGNSISNSESENNLLYYCTSNTNSEVPGVSDCEGKSGNGVTGVNYIFSNTNLANGNGCVQPGIQSFGVYKMQFWDVKGNADGTWGCKADDDDTDLGIGPVAIADNTNIRELYLISKDGKKRLFIRKKLVKFEDFDLDGQTNTSGEKLYKLQILKLRGFDIGSGHLFGSRGPSVNDGKIDTRACDAKEGFICKGHSIGGGYSGYRLPKDVDDGRTDLTSNDISIDDLKFEIYPTKNYDYAWSESNFQIAPYIAIYLRTRFYPANYRNKLNPVTLMNYTNTIQTTLSIKPY